MLKTDIAIRDPFVLVDQGKYYLYGTRVETVWGKADGFDVYVSDDLIHWSKPIECFHNNGDFWADMNYWAPEVHAYRGNYYMFASFYKEGKDRGTQILESQSPLGPFCPISDGPITPKGWDCLDGTFYVENGIPYIVFCHEWAQIGDGTICYMKLSDDLTHAIEKPQLMFHATDAKWSVSIQGEGHYVTDGPFFYKSDNGLLLLWSSHGKDGYVQALAYSDNDKLDGNWKHDLPFIFNKDGGHGMVFVGKDGKKYLTIHTPNDTPNERATFFEIEECDNGLKVKE